MKKLKSKLFFIQTLLLHLFLAIIVVVISWKFIEPGTFNFMVRAFVADKLSTDDIVVIVIDDKSIAHHRWPWPREYYGKIINFLNEYGKPKLIGYDAIISTPDKENPQSDKYFYDAVKNTPNLIVGFSPLMQPYETEDEEIYDSKFYEKFKVNIEPQYNIFNFNRYQSISQYPPEYFNAVKYAGSVNITQNANGYLTYMDQIVIVNNKFYPSLGLRMYLKLHDTDNIKIYTDKLTIDKTGLNIPAIQTPYGFQSTIKYYKERDNSSYTHKKYSAIDLINSYDALKQGKTPEINPKEFEGKIVFLGANSKAAALSLEDALPTPLMTKHPGVDIQATNLDNLMHNEFLHEITFGQELLILAAITILTFAIISKCPFFISIILLLAMAGGYITACIFCYRNGIAIHVMTPVMLEILTTIFGYSYRFLQEGKNKEKIKQAMGKYLSQDIMKNVVQNIDDIKLGGKRANVTVLFADIRGFTSMSEKMSAEDVSKILNEYFSEIEPIITKYNGVINKFIGDAVMAIFGEPIQDLNHPVNAVKCAYEMLKKVEQLQDKWLFEGKPKIEIGIGINTGDAFVGNIGSETRLEYTVIGDTVNLASRIESYNKVYKTNFLISSSTYSYVSSIADVIKISEVQIRGKSKKMDIYEILRLTY